MHWVRQALRRALPQLPRLSRRARWWLLAIVTLGAVLRILFAIKSLDVRPTSLADPVNYVHLGESLGRGDGYRYFGRVTAYYPPGYPMFLGGVFWLARNLRLSTDYYAVAVWANVILSVAAIPLLFAVARRILGHRVALVAAAIWALWPNLIFHGGIALTESLFLVVLLALILVAVASPAVVRQPGNARVITIGVLFGLAVAIRPTSAVLAPGLLIGWWALGRRAALRRLALVVLAAVVVIAPWTVRNLVVLGGFAPLSTNVGDNLCIAHNPHANGDWMATGVGCVQVAEGPEPRRREIDVQRARTQQAVQYIVDHPGKTVRTSLRALRITLANDHDGLRVAADFNRQRLLSPRLTTTLVWIADLFYDAVAVLAVVGLLWMSRTGRAVGRRAMAMVAGVCLLQLLSPMATFGDPRFKMPIYPALAIAAAWLLVRARSAERCTDAPPGG